MTIVDLVVPVVGALAGWSGWRAGGVHSVAGLLGRAVGAVVGLWVAHLVAATSWSFGWRLAAEIAVVLTGVVVSGRLARTLAPAPVQPSTPDRVVGLALRAVAGTVVAAGVVGALALWAPAAIARTVDGSSTAAAAAGPVTAIASDLRPALPGDVDGIIPSAATAGESADGTELSASETAATVQIVASHAGTRDTTVGSGFVVSGNRVVTAHHVIADASTVTVVAAGTDHRATVAADDAHSDITVLSVQGLGVTPVAVSAARVGAGTPAVFAGFPGGGPLRSGAATVVGGIAMPSVGSSSVALRPAYRLVADVRPGNSGGPLFDAAGVVIGMIDARSLTAADTGFAITTEPVLALLG